MKKFTIIMAGLLAAGAAWAVDAPIEARIEKAMLGEHRSEANIERNRYRHPLATLMFLGLEDGMSVMEIWPGGGWYTEVLAPALRDHGQFIVAGYDVDIPDQPEYRYRLQKGLLEKFAANPGIYDQVEVAPWSPPDSATLGDADSVDMVLTFRNTHGWISDGIAESVFAEFARVLKPGGILGVVQHRAAEDADPEKSVEMGYVPEQTVIDLAKQAGLDLEARSEVNANPADNRDHEEGVWSLPPTFAGCNAIESEDEAAACRSHYRVIGESDRMTLRFRKPLN